MRCNEKVFYHNEAQADAALAALIANNPKDPRNKFLRVYVCPRCGLLHVGHQRAKYVPKLLAAPKQPKGPTPGQAARAAKCAAVKAERQKFYQDYHDTLVYCRLMTDRDIARMIALGAKPRTVQIP